METITIDIHELNKLLQEKVKTNPFFTYHLSKEILEEVKALNMRIVSHTLMTKEWANSREKTAKIREQIAIEKFIDVYWNEKYTPTFEEIKERLKLH